MIEAPYLDKSFTARENMEYICRLRGVADVSKIDEILELVGLAHTGKKIVKHFSLGMKQRLGIAMALLPDPEIMVLHPSAAQSQRKSSEESSQSASLDLHVLSTPPAFILSQDQTLVKNL